MSRLTGQTASPATPEDGSIVAAQLSANSVTTSAILDSSITSAKILDASILNSDLAPNCVNSSKIQDGSITGTDIAIETITGSNLVPGTITFNEIANNTVLGSKLQDGGITNAKMGVDSVSSSNIIDGTIQGDDIAAGTVTLANLAPIPTLSLVGLGVGGSPASPAAVTLGSGLSFTGNVLNTTLPTFTDLNILRGNGTNVPVSDSRISFAGAGALQLGLVPDATGGFSFLNSGITSKTLQITGNGNSLFDLKGQPSLATADQAGGKVRVTTGSATGNQGSSFEIYTAPFGGASGVTVVPSVLSLGVFSLPLITVIEGHNSTLRLATSQVNGTIELNPTGTGVVNLRGNVKKPDMAMVSTTVNTSVAIPANTPTTVTFSNAGATTLGTGISFISASTIAITRPGKYQVIFTASVRSATANARGMLSLTIGGGATASGILPTKAIRLLGANVDVETTWVFVLPLLTPGNIVIATTMTAASTLVAHTTAFATATTSSIQIMEIA